MNIGKIIFGLIVVVIAYPVVGMFVLSTSQETINGQKGKIWNQIKIGSEKLDAVETQLKAAYKDRQDILTDVTAARKDYAGAVYAHDLDGATHAASKLASSLKVVVENYPTTDISGLQVGTLDETAGIFNRIAYARTGLIDSQVSFNQKRVFFFPLQGMYPREQVLGELSQPDMEGPKSSFKSVNPA